MANAHINGNIEIDDTGHILSDLANIYGLSTKTTNGYSIDQYGNLTHQRSNTSDYFVIANNAGEALFKYYYETGKLVCNELYFNSGDTYSFASYFVVSTFVSSAKTTFYINLPVPKSLENISSISVTGSIASIRGVSGYIDINNTITDLSNYTVTAKKSGNYGVYFTIKNTNGWTCTNNTPVSIEFYSLKFTFK
jgi:hypothetical protein